MRTISELRDMAETEIAEILQKAGLEISGTGDELIARVLEHEKKAAEAEKNAQGPGDFVPPGSGDSAEGKNTQGPAPVDSVPSVPVDSSTPVDSVPSVPVDSSTPVDSVPSVPVGSASVSPTQDSASNTITPESPSSYGAAKDETVRSPDSLHLYKPVNGQDLSIGGGIAARGVVVTGGSQVLDMYLGTYLDRTEITADEAKAHAASAE
jgi:hypothetical protein